MVALAHLSEIAHDFSTWLSHGHWHRRYLPPGRVIATVAAAATGGTDARIRGAEQGAGGTCACTHNAQKKTPVPVLIND
jgi:hypothetical protein